MHFKERLRMLRKENGYTQTVVADALNYGYTAISNYESGKNQPSIEDLIRLSELFHVSVDYLIGNSDIRDQNEILKKTFWNIGDEIKIKNEEEPFYVCDVLTIYSKKEEKQMVQYILDDHMAICMPESSQNGKE